MSELKLGFFEEILEFLILTLEFSITSVSLASAVFLAQTLDSGVFSVLKNLVAISWKDEPHAE